MSVEATASFPIDAFDGQAFKFINEVLFHFKTNPPITNSLNLLIHLAVNVYMLPNEQFRGNSDNSAQFGFKSQNEFLYFKYYFNSLFKQTAVIMAWLGELPKMLEFLIRECVEEIYRILYGNMKRFMEII